MKKTTILRRLIKVEIRLGFLYVPSAGVQYFPAVNGKISAEVDGVAKKLTYNAEHRRIFGLTDWYKNHKAIPKDEVVISVLSESEYSLSFASKAEKAVTAPEKEAEELLDLSGLSSQAKGDVVEDRIKELLVLHGQGLLSVFKPVTDTEGIDLIVTTTGQFHPIFLQVKGRYTLHQNRSIILSVNAKTFRPHPSFFVVGAYFNPAKLEIHEQIFLIPSAVFANEGVRVKKFDRYQIAAPVNPKSKSKWTKYLIPKGELANRLLDQFGEMNKFFK